MLHNTCCPQFQLQLPELRDGLSAQDKAAIPCNAARRPVATCAHRGNAAELLRGAGVTPGSGASVLQQMQLLWKAGVGCFDMDINHLAGEEGCRRSCSSRWRFSIICVQ